MEADKRSIHKNNHLHNTYFTKLIFQFCCSIFDLSTRTILSCEFHLSISNINKTIMEFGFNKYSFLSKYVDFFKNLQPYSTVDNFTLNHGQGGRSYGRS